MKNYNIKTTVRKMAALSLWVIALLICLFCNNSLAQGWERVYPDHEPGTTAQQIVAANDGGYHVLISKAYVAAAAASYTVMKIDANGLTESTVDFGINEQHVARTMIEAANGDLIILSETQNASFTDSDVTFLRIDTDYNIISETTFGDPNNYEQPRSIVELPNGEFWVAGSGGEWPTTTFLQKLDANGEVIGQLLYDNFSRFYNTNVLTLPNGGARVIGYGKVNNTGNTKILINEFESDGTYTNQLVYSAGIEHLYPNDILETADGGFLMTGRRGNNNTPLLLKTDAAGVELWRNEYTVPGFLLLSGLVEKVDGTGYRLLYREQYPSVLQHSGIIDADLNGDWNWKKEYAIHYLNEGKQLLALADGGTIMSGERSLSLNNPFVSNNGIPYLVRTDANGNTFESGVEGSVANDDTDDCILEGIDLSIGKFVTAYQNGVGMVSAPVDSQGNYNLPAMEGSYQLAVNLPNFLWSSCQDSLSINVPTSGVLSNQDFVIAYNNEPLTEISGYHFEDYDHDCFRDSFETIGYEGWIVHLEIYEDGNTLLTDTDTTDENGFYSFTDLNGATNGAGVYMYFESPIGTGLTCGIPCSQEVELGPFMGTSVEFNNGMNCDTLPFCPIMSVSIATDEIRPCIEDVYQIYYSNIGGYTAEDAYLEVTIDSALAVVESTPAWDAQQGNVYTYNVGDLLSSESGVIALSFVAPCTDTVGTTYCSSVYAYPDSTCVVPGPEWDGSEIELSVACLGDSIRFTIENVGAGNMALPHDYIVIEDNVLLSQPVDPYQLLAGTETARTFPADGFFYRMQTEQAAGFPGLNTPITWIEGCGANEEVSLGMVNQYPLGDEDTWEDIFCLESTNSYDPNDKTGFPLGVSEEHYIDQNVPMEYLIRFQNTGTAEALYVEIRDTLPFDLLNINTLRTGASSHPYTWDLEGNGVIVFKFENINLPALSTDEEGSKGFVELKIRQYPDLPIGTEINNTAAIYFDNNAPIITNETLHTIGEDYLSTWTKEVPVGQLKTVSVYPNPVSASTHIQVKGLADAQQLEIELYDVLGSLQMKRSFENNGNPLNLERLENGTYFFKIYEGATLVGVGKVIRM